jgi:uncharacterized protein
MLDLWEATCEKQYLNFALELQEIVDRDFWDSKENCYFFTDGADPSEIIRVKEFTDGATPSGNSVQLLNLYRLFQITCDNKYFTKAKELREALSGFLANYPTALARAVIALDYAWNESQEYNSSCKIPV